MKTSSSKPSALNGKYLRIAIILARYNDSIGSELLKNTHDTLVEHGVGESNIKVLRVPGALELPLAALIIAKEKIYDAIIALGVVIKGETAHFEHVCEQSLRGLMDVGLETETPVVFGVITAMNEAQARERANKDKLNKGREYAETAIEMAGIRGTFR
jgi:6,7-dimethyl-8-ribityllumazine synthase